MKQTTKLLLLLLAIALQASAQPISQQKAMERAALFLKSAPAVDGARKALKEQPQLTDASIGTDHIPTATSRSRCSTPPGQPLGLGTARVWIFFKAGCCH